MLDCFPASESRKAIERVQFVLGGATSGLCLDEISAASGLDPSHLAAVLLELEREGLARQQQRRWCVCTP